MLRRATSLAVLICAFAGPAAAQDSRPSPPPSIERIRVFVDCGICDQTHLRQSVGFVDYVAERTVADFHLLVTTQGTGGGGLAWTLQFIGLGRFEGRDVTLKFDTPATATESDRNVAFERRFMLGLVGPAAGTAAEPELGVTWTVPTDAAKTATVDPWRAWVFTLRAGGNMSGEESNNSRSHNLRFSSNRTTNAIKINVSASRFEDVNTFELEAQSLRSKSSSWNLNSLVVGSLGPHWSVGATGAVSHSTFSNVHREVATAPAIEFNVFPYAQSSRRSLTFHYAAGASQFHYASRTIFDRLREVVPRHAFRVTLALQQPWGSMDMGATFTQHLRHLDRSRASFNGSADVRLFKGLSFNAFGRYERIRDQISLPKEAASEEDRLLRIQQLATGYSYFVNFGISYRFGSIFNSIVNSRFDNSPF